MCLQRTDPAIVNGVPQYTLSSYDPVTVTVASREISDEDLDTVVLKAVQSEGGNLQKMLDDEWVHEKFPEVQSADELREFLRNRLVESNDDVIAQRKIRECADALAARLEQRVLQSEIESAHDKVTQLFIENLNESGITPEQFLKFSGITQEDLQEWIDSESVALANQGAAIRAFAQHRQIDVTKEEVMECMTAMGVEKTDLMRGMFMPRQFDTLRRIVLDRKVMQIVLDECNCTYDNDKPLSKFDPWNGYPTIRLYM